MALDDLYPFAAAPRVHALGSDIAGASTIDYALTVNTGRRSLADRILRRLSTPRGGLFYSPEYGYDLKSAIGSTVLPGDVEQRVLEQVQAEEEVADASCTATLSNGTLTIILSVVDAQGPFDLVITATDLTVSALIEGVEIFNEAT